MVLFVQDQFHGFPDSHNIERMKNNDVLGCSLNTSKQLDLIKRVLPLNTRSLAMYVIELFQWIVHVSIID
jgi:hypothetical protein